MGDFTKIDSNILLDLEDIVWQFEPERLSCDGELSSCEVTQKVKRLTTQWNVLVGKIAEVDCIDFVDFQSYVFSKPLATR